MSKRNRNKKANAEQAVSEANRVEQTEAAAEIEQAEVKPHVCECGCGGQPAGKKSRYLPGHDAKHHSARNPKQPVICACGCGGQTKGGRFQPGHDARFHAAEKKAAKLRDEGALREAAMRAFGLAA